MTESVCKKFLENICAYFEKKIPKETGSIWHDEIIKIPDESLDHISFQLKKKESFPRNFPATCWALYYQWLKGNPTKQALSDCSNCDGSGWLTVNKKAYKCGICNKDDLFVHLEIPGFNGQVLVKTKSPNTMDWHDQF